MTRFFCTKKLQNRPKEHQNGPKMGSKRCNNSPKMMPKRSQNDPDRPKNGPKSPKNDSKMTDLWPVFWPLFDPFYALFWAILTVFFWLQKGSRWRKGVNRCKKKSSKVTYTFIKVHKNPKNPPRMLPENPHLLHTFMGWSVDFDRLLSKRSVL